MTRPTLYGIRYSPWTLRARWALDHHGLDYRYREHVPFLGEPLLRLRSRAFGGGRPTVPLLVSSAVRIGDSLSIIEHADEIGAGASLRATSPDVIDWARRVEPCLAAIRARVSQRTLRDSEALREAASGVAPQLLTRPLAPVAAMGVRHLARKYGFDVDRSEARATDDGPVTKVLVELRSALGDGPFILDTFSAADILAATILQGVRPAEDVAIGPATRRMWQDEALAERFADLLEWRDVLQPRLG